MALFELLDDLPPGLTRFAVVSNITGATILFGLSGLYLRHDLWQTAHLCGDGIFCLVIAAICAYN